MSDSMQNPLLARIKLPGETFQIPSQGLFYTNGELDESVKNGEIEVFPMSTMDEIIFNTPDKLLSGKAIVEVFERCIPQVKKPKEMLAKDVDFLLVCLRLVTFGNSIEVSTQHTCETATINNYAVDLQKMIRSTKKIDPTSIESEYTTILPNGQKVEFIPMSYGDILRIYEATAIKKSSETVEEAEQLLLSMLTGMIKSVDGITDSQLITEWTSQLPLGWKKLMEASISKMSNWGVDFSTTVICKDCGEEMMIQVSANPVSFFFQQ